MRKSVPVVPLLIASTATLLLSIPEPWAGTVSRSGLESPPSRESSARALVDEGDARDRSGALHLQRSVPTRIAFQGFLTDNTGTPVDNEFPGVTIEVALFDAASGGTQVWPAAAPELHPGVPVRNGVFEIELGALSSLDPDDFDGSALYLEVTVESEVLSPRTELLSSPFAMRSRNADQADAVAPGAAVTSVNGLTDDVSLVAGPNVTITPSGNTLTIDATGGGGADADWTVAGDDMHSAVSGNVGVGTVAPEKKLHIAGSLLLEGTAEDIAVRDGEALQFGQWNGTEFVEKMRLNGSGKLGIGTATPDQTLDVVGDARFGGGSVDPDGTTEFISIRGTSAMYSFQVENDSTAAESDLFVTSEAGEVLRVTNDGEVGIGTATPSGKLEVTGDVHVSSGGNLHVGTDNPDDDDTIYFGTGTSDFLRWDRSDVHFDLSDDLALSGVFQTGSQSANATYNRIGTGSASQSVITNSSDLFVTQSLEVDGAMYADGSLDVAGTTDLAGALNVTGNLSASGAVNLPPGAVSSSEIANEPGIAALQSTSDLSLSPGEAKTLVWRTINVPTSGYVIAIGTASVASISEACLGIRTSPGPVLGQGHCLGDVDGLFDGQQLTHLPSVHRTFSVSAGSHSFYFVCEAGPHDVEVFKPRLSLVFVPTAYGTVTEPSANVVDHWVEPTPDAVVREQQESREFAAQQIAAELDEVREKLVELQRRVGTQSSGD